MAFLQVNVDLGNDVFAAAEFIVHCISVVLNQYCSDLNTVRLTT